MDSSLFGLYEHLYIESPKIRAREKCQNRPTPTHPDQPKLTNSKNFQHLRFSSKLWIQYMNMVDIMKKFIRAERLGNCYLHLTMHQKKYAHLCMHVTSKRIELESPGWLGFVENSKPNQT